jgi:hypothetical protein
MSQERQGPHPDDTPRPVTTRWSEDPAVDDDDLARPFVPGRSRPPEPSSGASETPNADESPVFGLDEENAPFPFEGPADSGPGQDVVPAFESGPPLSGPTDDAPEDPGAPEDEFPFAALDQDLDPADALEVEADRSDFLPGDGGAVTTEEDAVDAGPGPDGWEPFEPGEAEGAGDAEAEAVPAESEPAPSDAVEEVAGLLERLARQLRTEGVTGLEAELTSPDRLAALVAGVLAGYVSGRS